MSNERVKPEAEKSVIIAERVTNEVDKVIKRIEQGRTVIEETCYVNITPWWGKGPFSTMIDPESGEPSLPTSKTVIGKVRWLLRWFAAEILGEGYEKADKMLLMRKLGSVTIGEGSRASHYRIIVNSNIMDGIQPFYLKDTEVNELANELASFIVETLQRDENRRILKNGKIKLKPLLKSVLISIPECIGFTEHISRDGEANITICNESISVRRNEKIIIDAYEVRDRYTRALGAQNEERVKEYFKLFTIPRIKYVLEGRALTEDIMNNCNEIKNITHRNVEDLERSVELRNKLTNCVKEALKVIRQALPLRPGSVRLCVKVLRRVTKPDKQFEELLERALGVVLKLIGIGYASTRGFGRFAVITGGPHVQIVKDVDHELKTLCLSVAKVLKVDDSKGEYKCSELVNRIVRLKVSHDKIKHPCLAPQKLWPAISREIAEGSVYKLRKWKCIGFTQRGTVHDYRKNLSNDVLEVLSAIGYTTLKAVWKMVRGELKRVGFSYHTWPLGLPRGVRKNTWATGYQLAKISILPFVKEYIKESINNWVVREDDASEYLKHIREARRVSPIIISPYISENGINVIVLDFLPYNEIISEKIDDYQTILNSIHLPEDRYTIDYKLSVVGQHKRRKYDREHRRTEITTVIIQGVKEIITKDKDTIDKVTSTINVKNNDYGYVTPSGIRYINNQDVALILEEMMDVTLEWIRNLLT